MRIETTSFVSVKYIVVGFHHWPLPNPNREYLGESHRHRFTFTVTAQVSHDNRQIEFHDLLEEIRRAFVGVQRTSDGSLQFGGLSCESIAKLLHRHLAAVFGLDRKYIIEVSEDGECSGVVIFDPRSEDMSA